MIEFTILLILAAQSMVLISMGRMAHKQKRPALFIYVSFYLFYLTIRPILLATESNVIYAYVNPDANDPDKMALFLAVLYSSIFLIISRWFLIIPKNRIFFKQEKTNSLKLISGIALFCSAVSMIILDLFIFAMPLAMYSISCLYLSDEKSGKVSILIYIALALLTYGFFIYSDDRRDWLALIFIIIFMIYRVFDKPLAKALIFSILGLFAIVYLSISFRTEGILNPSATIERLQDRPEVVQAVLEVETDFSHVYDDIVQLFSQKDIKHLYGLSYIKPLFGPIPRALWEDKPETASRLYAKEFNIWFYNIGGSQPITFIGESYWNFGYFGLALAGLLGFAIKKLDLHILKGRSNAAPAYATVLILFSVFRGPFDNFIWLVIVIYAAHYIINLLIKRTKRKKMILTQNK